MKRIIAIAIAAFTVAVASAQQFTETRFEGKKITGASTSGTFKVTITQGNSTKATVNIPERFKDKLKFKLTAAGVIEVGLEGRVNSERDDKFELNIVCSSLNTIRSSGACRVELMSGFTSDGLYIGCSGASKITGEQAVNVSGDMKVSVSGATKIDMAANVSGKLDLGSSGASKIEMDGSADSVKIGVSGSSNINLSDMTAKNVSVGASGASKIDVNASESLNVSASGSTKVLYSGSPKLTLSTSGSSSVSHK